jgi:hypothetical protein
VKIISQPVSKQRAAPGFRQAFMKELAMQNRSGTLFVWSIIVLGAVGLGGSCSRSGESGSSHTPLAEESAMKIQSQHVASPGTMPLIDTTAPHVFGTATFGLG